MSKQMKSTERRRRRRPPSLFCFRDSSAIFIEDDTDGRTQRAFPVQCCCVPIVWISFGPFIWRPLGPIPLHIAVDKIAIKASPWGENNNLTTARIVVVLLLFYKRHWFLYCVSVQLWLVNSSGLVCVVPVWEKNTHIRPSTTTTKIWLLPLFLQTT